MIQRTLNFTNVSRQANVNIWTTIKAMYYDAYI